MTFRTATLAALSTFSFACADAGTDTLESQLERAALPTDLDGIGNSTDGEGATEEGGAITQDDVPRLVQGLMQDIYDSEDSCVPGATILGSFSADTVSGKALDTSWKTAATFTGDLYEDGSWDAEWIGVSDAEIDPNDPVVPEVETGEIDGLVISADETFEGVIYMSDTVSMDISGYWIPQSDISGFFFGVAWDCE
jgi:hypothetical protein